MNFEGKEKIEVISVMGRKTGKVEPCLLPLTTATASTVYLYF